MSAQYTQEDYSASGDQFFTDLTIRLRELEERQKLLKDRMLLVSQTLIKEREQNFNEIEEMKKTLIALKSENERMQEIIKRMAEHIPTLARKEEVMTLQRQFDLFRE